MYPVKVLHGFQIVQRVADIDPIREAQRLRQLREPARLRLVETVALSDQRSLGNLGLQIAEF